jgi:uncharacterized protein (TIGR03067 family)
MASVTRLTITGLKLKYTGPLGDMDGFINTDVTQNPMTFEAGGIRDTRYEFDRINWSGIYDIQGDTLTLCFLDGTSQRPKEFKSRPAVILVLKRVK